MPVAILGSLIIWLIVAVIVIAIVVYFVNWLYRRSSKELSFVRTGLFGEKVVINSGELQADGANGGRIDIGATNFQNSGRGNLSIAASISCNVLMAQTYRFRRRISTINPTNPQPTKVTTAQRI